MAADLGAAFLALYFTDAKCIITDWTDCKKFIHFALADCELTELIPCSEDRFNAG